MNYKHVLRPLLKGGDPGNKPVHICMSTDTIHRLNVCPHINFLSEYLYSMDPILQHPAQGSLCLVAGKNNGTFRPPQIVFQMVAYPARVTHTGR